MDFTKVVLLVALGLQACDGQPACIGDACNQKEQDDGNVLLQKKLKVEKVEADEQRAASADAQFLIQATFGPTRASMAELGSTDYIGWIKKQMSLPVESHREYYRARVSPKYESDRMPGHSPTSQCTKGSRWRGHVFDASDAGFTVKVAGGKISVGDPAVGIVWRSDIDNSAPSAACTDTPDARMKSSRRRSGQTCAQIKWSGSTASLCASAAWSSAKRCQKTCYEIGRGYPGDECSGGWQDGLVGVICSIDGGDSGKVGIMPFTRSTPKRVYRSDLSKVCRDRKKVVYMPNPAIFLKDKSKASKTTEKFYQSAAVPGTLFFTGGACKLAGKSLIDVNGKYFGFDSRMAFVENTLSRPQASDKRACVQKHFLNAQGCTLQPNGTACAIACGSPGEIASVGVNGHQYLMTTVDSRATGVKVLEENPRLDNRYTMNMAVEMPKYIVWMMKALQARDQLRQRTAWALAQIIVLGVPGNLVVFTKANECWMSTYDIFVRNAFGNFRDILQQMTYNPMMGMYLTYMYGRSFDQSGKYPDENYAREIMQLFTVGTELLHRNGSVVKKNGVGIPAYTNENIMNFARVFTGFRKPPMRSNFEYLSRKNTIDPMFIEARDHDRYPKPDITGGYLGDGYPLCADFPKFGYLLAGAKFEFIGYEYSASDSGEAFELPAASGLQKALCGHSSGQCVFSLSVTLKNSVKCVGQECQRDTVGVVKAGGGYYEYVAPPCVHHFIYNGQVASTAATSRRRSAKTVCLDPNAPAAKYSCCNKGCTDKPTGWMTRHGYKCSSFHMLGIRCNMDNPSVKYWRQNNICQLSCWKKGGKHAYPGDDCSDGVYAEKLQCDSSQERVSYSTAQAACKGSNMEICAKAQGTCGDRTGMPLWTQATCSTKVKIHDDGKMTASGPGGTYANAANRFEVYWKGNAANAGDHDATVVVQKLFTAVPAKDELIAKAKIGAVAPSTPCTVCAGEVKAYSASKGVIDEHTIFEAAGRFFKNAESMVQVNGGMFRNPPVFLRLRSAADTGQRAFRRAAYAEVDSLIDHLFHHPNTPVNLAKKMLQRFVTSNPSPAQIEAAVDAFSSGTYSGTTFTGKYGDLGAMVAAILLHPEARKQDSAADGLLREPMLKLMHFMRSMEYKDKLDQPIVFDMDGAQKIGQWPYYSPSVFSFFAPDFMPKDFDKTMSSGPEPEPEPEPLVAPEFQIFTPPLVINLLNGFTSLAKWGVSPCSGGLGRYSDGCRGGSFEFKGSGSADSFPDEGQIDSTIQDINLMLTGGRLTQKGIELVKTAYVGTNWCHPGQEVTAAQTAMLLGPEFNTLGNPLPKGTRHEPPPPATDKSSDYKAVVLVYLNGGADTYNMLVPRDCKLHDEYAKTRAGMNIKISDLLPIHAKSQTCQNFGLTNTMPNLQKLYENKQAAFISNIGNLMEPVTRTKLKGGAVRNCPQLFSHSHAQLASQICKCPGGDMKGSGGGMADALGKKKLNTAAFSVAGVSSWMRGKYTSQEIVDSRQGAVRFGDYELWGRTVNGFSDQEHGNVYCEEYAKAFKDAIEGNEKLALVLGNISSPSLDRYTADTSLSRQLKQVARLIHTREERKAERDFFFVQKGGWDMHAGVITALPFKLGEVDAAIAGFVAEMQTQNIFDSVVVAMISEFGRTLSFNGAGTDHGWGGNSFIVGGSINGGEVYNDFLPSFQPGNEWDAGRGRVIPKYPWENMMVPIAEWMGVDAGDMSTIFPNLDRFNRSEHILSRDTLFKTSSSPPSPSPPFSPIKRKGGGSGALFGK